MEDVLHRVANQTNLEETHTVEQMSVYQPPGLSWVFWAQHHPLDNVISVLSQTNIRTASVMKAMYLMVFKSDTCII